MNKKKTKNYSNRLVRRNKQNSRLLWAATNNETVLFSKYTTGYEGYDSQMVDTMREHYGENKITHQKKLSLLHRLIIAFVNPFTLVLFALAMVSLITDVVIAAPGEGDPTAVIIITAMVTISGLLRFVQESRSGKAAERLTAMVETTISIQRGKEGRQEMPICELVVGDIVHLAAGDMVPADLRILQAKDLFISQSTLTGESDPLEKLTLSESSSLKNPLDCRNLAFMGSNVISGSAIAIVIGVGDNTLFGEIAQDITEKKPQTSFEKGVNSVSWVLIRFMLVMVPIVLFLNGFTKGDWLDAFLFALSVAVGLTPEMLPMLVSANLARGAVTMSKHQVIVKDLNAIQNFGAMDVLCTDKTGTLTQDKVVLLHSLDIHGKENERVLRHAFINSSHQTGLKNLMDIAVIQYAHERSLTEAWNGYRKVDEIPFDFNRRRMSVVVEKEDKTQLITKGAVEEMLSICSLVEYQGRVEPITNMIKKEIQETVACYNARGMRVLAVAQKSNPSPIATFSIADEADMVLMGYLAFLDPPKESTAKAIHTLQEYGVSIKILTGDNDAVTRCICKQVGIPVEHLICGCELEKMSDQQLQVIVEKANVFAKLSPAQKARVVTMLRANGHTVGFMGDGINDASAMKMADVGISVDTAVDIAKETANIILLKKDLMVLERGVIEGRKTYANIIKYIKMTASSNFGNMFSVLAASAFLPFLPMLPIQLLALNLIYDISCLTIPWDNVDKDYLKVPRKWDASSISKFMLWIGPTSSVFDITTYVVLYFFICPMMFGGFFKNLDPMAQASFIMLFQTGWFVESLWSQTLVIHMIRTPKIPFIQSRASWQLTLLTTCGIAVGTLVPFTPLGHMLCMMHLPLIYFPCLIVTIFCYMVLATVVKKVFVKRYGELL
ncbi:MAG: magnesium-translocating P-type ATPase [Lachnospiraceae bacterium]